MKNQLQFAQFERNHHQAAAVGLTKEPWKTKTLMYLPENVREHVPVRDGQSSIYGSLQGSEHFVPSGGSGKAGIQVASEGTGLSINALHIELVSGDLYLALVHLIQAKFVQQLRIKILNEVGCFFAPNQFMDPFKNNIHNCLRLVILRAKYLIIGKSIKFVNVLNYNYTVSKHKLKPCPDHIKKLNLN